jgi:hypothetical protein
MPEVLCLLASPQEMSKNNSTMSNQTQVDALSTQDYWSISHEVTRLFTEAPDESPPTDAMLRLLTQLSVALLPTSRKAREMGHPVLFPAKATTEGVIVAARRHGPPGQ